jgi:hypothetical protein
VETSDSALLSSIDRAETAADQDLIILHHDA